MSTNATILGGAGVRYDPKKHLYSDQFGAIPSVTQALRACGMIDGKWHTESAAWRGTVVHHAIALDATGTLDETTLHPDLHGYLAAWRTARSSFIFSDQIPIHVEQPVASTVLRTAGTVDLAYFEDLRLTIVDIKTGAAAKWHEIQVAGYGALLAEHHAIPSTRVNSVVLYLAADGKYELSEFGGEAMSVATATFRAAARIANWRIANGWNPAE